MTKLLSPTREPLGLPRGSIRAILALLLTIGVVAAVLGTLSQPALAPGAILLAQLDLMVLRDYFEKRATEPARPEGGS